jgi:hypothetical protein
MPLKPKVLLIEFPLIKNLVLSQLLFEGPERGVRVETAVERQLAHLFDACDWIFTLGVSQMVED